MINDKITKQAIMGLFFIIAFLASANAQTDSIKPIKKYRAWSITTGPLMYFAGQTSQESGEYTITNSPILSYTAGIDLRIVSLKKSFFSIGLHTNKEPVFRTHYKIDRKDIPSFYESGIEDKDYMYSINSFSLPVHYNFTFLTNNNYSLSILTGARVIYFPPGEGSLIVAVNNEDETEIIEIFGIKAKSPNQLFHSSILLGAGIAFPRDKVRWSADLVCNINFKPLMTGEYLFDNLMVSPRSSGKYTLSGNYIGLVFRMNLIKSKKETNS